MFVSVGSLNVLGAWIGDGIESSRADISGKNNAIEQSKFSASSLIRLYSIFCKDLVGLRGKIQESGKLG